MCILTKNKVIFSPTFLVYIVSYSIHVLTYREKERDHIPCAPATRTNSGANNPPNFFQKCPCVGDAIAAQLA